MSMPFLFRRHIQKALIPTRGLFAYDSKSIAKGVKGLTCLSRLKSYDLVLGTGIDNMHSVLLGVMCLFMFV